MQGRQIHPHEGLVGCDPAAAGRVDGLEVVGHQLFLQQALKVLLGLGGVCLLMVAADIKITHAALVGMLDLIHGKVGIFFRVSRSWPSVGYQAMPPEMLMCSCLPLGRMDTLRCRAALSSSSWARS